MYKNLEPQIELGHFDAQSVDNKEHRKDHCTQWNYFRVFGNKQASGKLSLYFPAL